MYTLITFFNDDTAKIEYHENGMLKSQNFVKANSALVWMVKQEKVWKWFKDDEGNEIAIWEKEEN